MTIYIAFDLRSGHILGVHQGENAVGDARRAVLKNPHRREPLVAEHVGELQIVGETLEPGRRYKVDTRDHRLVVADEGVSFGFGSVGRSPRPAGRDE